MKTGVVSLLRNAECCCTALPPGCNAALALSLIRCMANGQELGREIIDSLIKVMFTPLLSTIIICLTQGLLSLL